MTIARRVYIASTFLVLAACTPSTPTSILLPSQTVTLSEAARQRATEAALAHRATALALEDTPAPGFTPPAPTPSCPPLPYALEGFADIIHAYDQLWDFPSSFGGVEFTCLVPRLEERTLELLKERGPSNLLDALAASDLALGTDSFYEDMTGDGLPELIFRVSNHIYVIGSSQGEYAYYLAVHGSSFPEEARVKIVTIQDINDNQLTDLVLTCSWCHVGRGALEVAAFEWDGSHMVNLIPTPMDAPAGEWPWMDRARVSVEDTNGDGLFEVLLAGGLPYNVHDEYCYGPWRETTEIYAWDGQVYALYLEYFGPPTYRFQAVQDADELFAKRDLAGAESLYRLAITSTSLLSWSPALAKQACWPAENFGLALPTPSPIPDDPDERLSLAAYARYRLILVNVAGADPGGAQLEYDRLSADATAGSPGYPYLQLATAFWEVFQSGAGYAAACNGAREYAEQHPSILAVIGSDYHGIQARDYEPADVCPSLSDAG